MLHILELPSMGEDIDANGTIIDIPIKAGDTISIGDTLIEIETDKVTLEVPSEHDGVIEEILLKVGDQVRAGLQFAKMNLNEVANVTTEPEEESRKNNDEQVIPAPIQTPPFDAAVSPVAVENSLPVDARGQSSNYIKANPAARRLAREIGISLVTVVGSGKHGRISKEDVKRYAKSINTSNRTEVDHLPTSYRPLPDFSEFGAIQREALSRIAITTSSNMSHAWSRIPHAWLQQSIDITELEEWRKQNKEEVKKHGGALTLTVILTKAIAIALKSFPKLKSSYDEKSNEIIYKDYTDVGVAVDTNDALVVPILRRVDKKGLVELSTELTELSVKARERKLSPKDMLGAGITISNLGGIGLNGIFPIVNWPQVAIVGVAASTVDPVYVAGDILPRRRLMTTLGFDHRVINGAEGARFLVHLKNLLEDTRLMLL